MARSLTALMSICAIVLAGGVPILANASPATMCQSMTAQSVLLDDPTARIDSAVWHGETETVQAQLAPGLAMPLEVRSHCEVTGSLQHRKGANGQAYAVRFRLRLPAAWNNRFLFQGGSGSNGEIGDALGHVGFEGQIAINSGYAVVSQDSGHDNATNSDPTFNGQLAFGFDPQARENYGHASLKLVAEAAKTLIGAYYGSAPRFSYFVGCSKGGQEGMVFATRYPDEFDGIVAAAPGFSLPRAALAEAWDVQAFAPLVVEGGRASSNPMRLFEAFTSGDLDMVRSAILQGCDDKDGLKDGIVGDFYNCSDLDVLPNLQVVACKKDKQADCLTTSQIAVLSRVVNGPTNSAGHNLYAKWYWPSGLAGEDWRLWKLGTSDGRIPPLNVILGGTALASVFTTPPLVLGPDPRAAFDYQLGIDFDRDASLIYALSTPYRTSAWSDISARSTDLSAFRKRGGKLIVPHGESDPVFSLKDTLDWYDEVNTRNRDQAAKFVRVFPVPGMCHCGGGQATGQYDAFTAVVNWVEADQPPAYLMATAAQNSAWPGRQRPICAYPLVSRYKGAGNPERAESFECRA